MRSLAIGMLLLAAFTVGCSGDNNSISNHCFDEQTKSASSLTLPAFVQTTCPTVNSPGATPTPAVTGVVTP